VIRLSPVYRDQFLPTMCHRQTGYGSYYYAMRHCEYLNVSGSRKATVSTTGTYNSMWTIASSVTAPQKPSKTGELMQRRTAWGPNDPILSPVLALASIVTESCPTGRDKKTSGNTALVKRTTSLDHSNDYGPSNAPSSPGIISIRRDKTCVDRSNDDGRLTRSRQSLPVNAQGYGPVLRPPLSGAAALAIPGGCVTCHYDHRPLEAALHGMHPRSVAQFTDGVSQRMILRQNYCNQQ
jgi:hypothetical protein